MGIGSTMSRRRLSLWYRRLSKEYKTTWRKLKEAKKTLSKAQREGSSADIAPARDEYQYWQFKLLICCRMVFQQIEATEQDWPFPGNAKHVMRKMVAALSRDTVRFLTGQCPPLTSLPDDHPRGITTVQHDFSFSAKHYVSATDDFNDARSEVLENRTAGVSAEIKQLSDHWFGLCRNHLFLVIHFRIREGWIEAEQYHRRVAERSRYPNPVRRRRLFATSGTVRHIIPVPVRDSPTEQLDNTSVCTSICSSE